MNLNKVVVQLRDELANLNAAIASLERLQQGDRRRGRPLKILVVARKSDQPTEKFRPAS